MHNNTAGLSPERSQEAVWAVGPRGQGLIHLTSCSARLVRLYFSGAVLAKLSGPALQLSH